MKRQLATLDCETDPFKLGRMPRPFIWGLYTPEKFCTFTTEKELVEYIRAHDLQIYAHNGGKFDFMFLLDYLEPGQDLKIINGRLAEFRLGKSVMRDSFCIFPMALSAYKKDTVDYDIMEAPNRKKHWAEIVDYLHGDCKYLYELVEVFKRDYGNGLTLAGAAMKFWQKECEVIAPRTNAGYYERYSPFYFGGRVECFQKGIFNEKIESNDIASAYPYAMLHPHPYGAAPQVISNLPDSNLHLCMVKLTAPSKGYLPIRTKSGTEFPHDGERREFFVTGYELQTVLDLDPHFDFHVETVHKFHEAITFEKYINHFYDIKKKAPKASAEYIFSKLMMNSLYGKFGANPSRYMKFKVVSAGRAHEWLDEGFVLVDRVYPWDLIAAPLDEAAQHYYDVALASSITGFVRAYDLAHLVNSYGLDFYKNPSLFYMDTDCTHSLKGTFKCQKGKELGQWETEFTAHRAAYAGKKLYALDDGDKQKVACKGVKLKAADIFRIAAGEVITWKNPAPTMSVKGGARFLERKVQMR